jgi:putative ABC transport system permease protein
MRPAWRLAINSLSARRNRSLLLIAAVMLSAALIAAVSCAMASLTRAVQGRLDETVGRSDLRIRPVGGGEMPASVLEQVRAWPEVAVAVPSLETSATWRYVRPRWTAGAIEGEFQREFVSFVGGAVTYGIDPAQESLVRTVRLIEGRMPQNPGEVAIDRALALHLSREGERVSGRPSGLVGVVDSSRFIGEDAGPSSAAGAGEAERLNSEHDLGIGDQIELVRLFRKGRPLKVVGIVAEPPFGGRWRAFTTLETLQDLTGKAGTISQVDVVLRKGVDPEAIAAAHRDDFARGIIVQTTQRITSGLEQNLRSQDLGFIVATVMAFLAAAFIITTGLSTGIAERQRELSIMRCIGATRGQLAWAQIIAGGLLGAAGAVLGVPLGVVLAALIIELGREHVPHGLAVSPAGLSVAALGAVLSGFAGALFAAYKAARISPLEGLSVRARPVRMRAIVGLACLGVGAVCLTIAIVFGATNGQFAFWGYATVGLPTMFIGYFLLSVPVLLLMSTAAEPLVRRVMRLPPRLLRRTVAATPYRYGFTAGAMMSGLAIMVAIWTQGSAILNDWIGKFEFPDAFAVGLNLTEESRKRVEELPFVTGTVPITLHAIETQAFGVRALNRYKTTFIAFDPEPFFKLTRLTWVQPTDAAGQEHARRRLAEGGAVIVAREFMATQGVGVGDTFIVKGEDGREHPMEIVGVVTSPGLELVSQFFSIGDSFTEQAIHAVFGSRKDLKEKLGSDAISMIQIGLSPQVSDKEAISRIRTTLLDAGLLDAGSGRGIKQELTKVIKGTMLISSSIAVLAMVISSFGVANIIIAGISARWYEFGVLRAVGASRTMLARLVLGEAVLIALAAGVLGTALGITGVSCGQRLDKLLMGLELNVRPPLLPIAAGWAAVLLVTVGAALPPVISLLRRRPRELLAAR